MNSSWLSKDYKILLLLSLNTIHKLRDWKFKAMTKMWKENLIFWTFRSLFKFVTEHVNNLVQFNNLLNAFDTFQ